MALARWLRFATTLLIAVLATSRGAWSATFTVDDRNDSADVSRGDGICATVFPSCTLRAAVQEANATPGPDVIEFASNVGSIEIFNWGPSEDGAATGDLDVTDDLTINGFRPDLGAARTLAGFYFSATDRLLDVLAGTVARFSAPSTNDGAKFKAKADERGVTRPPVTGRALHL